MADKLFYYSVLCRNFGREMQAILYINSRYDICDNSDSIIITKFLNQVKSYVDFPVDFFSVDKLKEERLYRKDSE